MGTWKENQEYTSAGHSLRDRDEHEARSTEARLLRRRTRIKEDRRDELFIDRKDHHGVFASAKEELGFSQGVAATKPALEKTGRRGTKDVDAHSRGRYLRRGVYRPDDLPKHPALPRRRERNRARDSSPILLRGNHDCFRDEAQQHALLRVRRDGSDALSFLRRKGRDSDDAR